MFTGIVREIGTVKSIARKGRFARLEVACDKVKENIDLGDSVAVNGICLSVIAVKRTLFFDVVGNTLKQTNLKRLKAGDKVNLENALKIGDTLSGHMVSGHSDGERPVKASGKVSRGCILDIGIKPGDEKYVVPKGSVSVDGVSLTIGEVKRDLFRIFLIPHTLQNSTLSFRSRGDHVNVEFDMMAKYSGKGPGKGGITRSVLSEEGFI